MSDIAHSWGGRPGRSGVVLTLIPDKHTLTDLQVIAMLAAEFPGVVPATLHVGDRRLNLGDGVDDCPEFRAALERAIPGLTVE